MAIAIKRLVWKKPDQERNIKPNVQLNLRCNLFTIINLY